MIEIYKRAYLKESAIDLFSNTMFECDKNEHIINMLFTMYSDPRRKYHNLNHIYYCLKILDESFSGEDYNLIRTAIWFHDVFYTGSPGHDETMSQKLMVSMFPKPFKDMNRVCKMIDLTANHGSVNHEIEQTYKVFLDMDMSILAAGKEAYNHYSSSIIQEYSEFYPKVSIDVIKNGRKEFLEKMLNSERIMFDPHLNDAAITNINNEYDMLYSSM